MKNPFIKDDNSTLWMVAIAGAIIAGVGVWLYLSDKGTKATVAEVNEHATDYLEARHPKKKKHKTDLHDLEELVHHHE